MVLTVFWHSYQGSILIYFLRDVKAAESTKGMGQEEKIVYKIIEESGNKGAVIPIIAWYVIWYPIISNPKTIIYS